MHWEVNDEEMDWFTTAVTATGAVVVAIAAAAAVAAISDVFAAVSSFLI